MQFEWDERKRVTNLEKHGLDFLDVAEVFEVSHVVVPSTISSELRFLAISVMQNRFVTVVYTMRGEIIRIISFRRSRHEERRKYHELYDE